MNKLKLIAGLISVAAISGCQSMYTGEIPLSEFDFKKSYSLNDYEVKTDRLSGKIIHNYTQNIKDLRFPCTANNCETNDFLILTHNQIDTIEAEALVARNRKDWKIDYNINVSMKHNELNVTFSDVTVYYIFNDTKTNETVRLPVKNVAGKDFNDIESFFEIEAAKIKSAY